MHEHGGCDQREDDQRSEGGDDPRQYGFESSRLGSVPTPFVSHHFAGTYRQLVEAAEVCQVAIIHPGKPRDPNEPGLEELLARAEPFR